MTNTDFDFLAGHWNSRQRRLVKVLAGCEAERVWRIWWASKNGDGLLDEPVVGRFDGGVGTFECDDVWEGTPIRVRYVWSEVDSPSPRWEQSFSTDGGRTWEVNWTASFSRT